MNQFNNNNGFPPQFNQQGNQYQPNQVPNNNYPNQNGNYQQNPYNNQGFPSQNQNIPDEFLQNPYNRQGYNTIEQGSMQEFYDYKKSRKKLYILIGFSFVVFIFLLGVFTTPFMDGIPQLLNEEQREVLNYSQDLESRTAKYFSNDVDYYELGIAIGTKTKSADVNTDIELSKEIASMEKLASELKTMESAQKVPPSFAGTNGLHQKMIGLLELRVTRVNDLRMLAQGQSINIDKFTQNFTSYVQIRNQVINQYNNKYEANFHKSLYDMKELEF